MTYWLDLFTGKTWEEFLAAGATVSGFRESRTRSVMSMEAGDILVCYATGVSRWIGLLEVTGPGYIDHSGSVWSDDSFPARVPVRLLVGLDPEYAVPVRETLSALSFHDPEHPNAWTQRFRGSPSRFSDSDGKRIADAIHRAKVSPVAREYRAKQWSRRPVTYVSPVGQVTIPDDEVTHETTSEPTGELQHADIQALLVELGLGMGLDVWVARNDQSRIPERLQPRLLTSLPTQFDPATSRTVEHIDVLWLRGKSIESAFEIEHTTAIYSGLLRMADLCAMQPNLSIKLYIVAPDERRQRVLEEIGRPAFSSLPRPLHQLCQYIGYSQLAEAALQYQGVLRHLPPAFLADIAYSAEPR